MILINGNFLCRNLTGIERFAFETCRNLDEILEENAQNEKQNQNAQNPQAKDKDDKQNSNQKKEKSSGKKIEFALLAPKNARTIPKFKKIRIIKSTKEIKSFPLWDMGIFARECKKQNATALDFSNTAPLGKNCGAAFLHDIYAASHPKDFSTFKEKLIRLYSKFSYKNIAKNAKIILTVSDFSKDEIKRIYKVPDEKIKVIPNGWDHFNTVEADEKIFERFSALKNKDFFFTLGSLSKRKNLKWIASYAKNHPEEIFAVSGKAISGLVPQELSSLKNLKNVVLLGYVTDGEVKALMQSCKAFVFPSYYEGFGIPPLEALSCGAKVVVSNDASLPEIYGKTAHYIDSKSTDINLNEILKESTEPPKKILEKYTYKNAAKELFKILSSI